MFLGVLLGSSTHGEWEGGAGTQVSKGWGCRHQWRPTPGVGDRLLVFSMPGGICPWAFAARLQCPALLAWLRDNDRARGPSSGEDLLLQRRQRNPPCATPGRLRPEGLPCSSPVPWHH